MKSSYIIFFSACLLFASTSYPMNSNKFEMGTIVRVVRGPEKYRNKVMIIKGTTKETWGFEDVDGAPEAFQYNPTIRYLETDHPGYGTVYYAQYAHNLFKDCVHESWIERAEDFDEDDIVTGASGRPTEGGGYVVTYNTLGESKREPENSMKNKLDVLRKGGDDGAFKKEYINKYFPDAQIEHESLIKFAPAELKQWFEGVAQENKTQPLLLYGAYGVGKTMTTQALTKEANCSLCYVGIPEDIREDSPSQFYKECLSRVNQNTCVILDNVCTLKSKDFENINWLVDICNAKKNLHLLAVAYYAKSKMPAALYNKFRSIKFPVPASQDRLKLLKDVFRQKTFADDVDEKFLEDFTAGLSNFTARDIESLRILVSLKSNSGDHEASPTVISRSHLEKGLKKLKTNLARMEFVFEECE